MQYLFYSTHCAHGYMDAGDPVSTVPQMHMMSVKHPFWHRAGFHNIGNY